MCASYQNICPTDHQMVENFREDRQGPEQDRDSDYVPTCQRLAGANTTPGLQAAVATPCGSSRGAVNRGGPSVLGTSQFAKLQDTSAWQGYEKALVSFTECGDK